MTVAVSLVSLGTLRIAGRAGQGWQGAIPHSQFSFFSVFFNGLAVSVQPGKAVRDVS